jgi:hypothetical protein
MVNPQQSSVNAALAVLATAVTKLGDRLTTLEVRLDKAREDRMTYLSKTTEAFLPKFSATVMANLQRHLAPFVTESVEQAFADNGPRWLFFSPRGADNALVMLQVQLSAYLDQNRFGDLPGMDARIGQLLEGIKLVTERRRETQDLLDTLKKALAANIALESALVSKLDGIVRRTQAHGSASRSPAQSSRSSFHRREVADDGDFDLWFDLITGIPTSMRTILLNVIFEHDRSCSTIVATNTVQVADATVDAAGGVIASDGIVLDPTMFAAAGAVIAAGAAAVILTDDTLGRFS